MKRCKSCMHEYDERYEICPACGYADGQPPQVAYHLHPGTILKNRYMVGKAVGFGGFGITYAAWDITLDKKVAIKEYYPSGVVNRVPGEKEVIVYSGDRAKEYAGGKVRFLDEARNAAKFNRHPNIVNVYEFFEENNTAYLAMEFLEGISFKDFIKQNGGKIPYETAVGIVSFVLDALKEIHRVHIIHRDVSPDNIFICKAGGMEIVKLIDFGAARFSSGEEEKELSIILKPGYAPPEQYQKKSRQGPWTDVYAAGAVLYRAITGQKAEESVNRVVSDELVPPDQLVEGLPKYINDSILRAMALNQDLRFQSAEQFQNALLNRQKIRSVDEETKYRKRLRNVVIAGAAAVVAAGAAACVGLYSYEQSAMYGLDAEIEVMLPDYNAELDEKYAYAMSYSAQSDAMSRQSVSSKDMFDDMLGEMQEKFTGIKLGENGAGVEIEASVKDYADVISLRAAEGDLPDVFDSTELDTAAENLGKLTGTYKSINSRGYYFVGDKEFREYYESDKTRFPLTFRAPVLFVNTNLIDDEEKLAALSQVTDIGELADGEGKLSVSVGADCMDMYLRAFDVDGSEEGIFLPAAGEYGFEPFLDRTTAYFLGTTDDYEAVQAGLGGIYRMIVPERLWENGELRGQFTHEMSIRGDLSGDEAEAADVVVQMMASEMSEDVFCLRNGNGLPLNRNMMKEYAEINDDMEAVYAAMGKLKMDYGEQ